MIPDEAVEAAARAAAKDEDASNWDDEPQYYRNGWLNRMQVALEAAAPHLISQGWDEGYKTGLFDKEYYSHNPNPYTQNGLIK